MKNKQNGGKWLNRNVAAMGFISLFSDASHEMATSMLAQFLTVELHGSAEILGLIEGLADFSSSFIKTYSGWLSDKLGKRKPLATLGYTLTGILYPYSPSHTILSKYYFIEQLGGLDGHKRTSKRCPSSRFR